MFGRLTAQPILSVEAAAHDDTPQGNRSGFPDPGEEVDLSLMVGNSGEIDATGLSGTIQSTTPGVTILEPLSTFDDITTGGSQTQQRRPAFRDR